MMADRPWWQPFTEANTYGGIGVFITAIGTTLVGAGDAKIGGIIAGVGGAFTAVMFYISREGKPDTPAPK